MTDQERNKRRALIVRRQAAYRVSRAQREIWRKRKGTSVDDPDEVVGDVDLLVDLPEGLLG